MRLDYSSIEIIKEILAVREISINDLCAKLSISRRTFYYRLDKINDWLAENGFSEVHNQRYLGVALSEPEKPAIQGRLASMADSVYELSGDERRSNILLLLLTPHSSIFIPTISELNKVSRNTALDDLHQVGQEIRQRNRLELCFLKKRGYFIDGTALNKRLCLFYFLQRGLKYKNNFLENTITRILAENAGDARRTPEELKALAIEIIQWTQRRLGRKFTDKDCRLLRFALLLFCLDVVSDVAVSFTPKQREYLRDMPEFQVGSEIRQRLEAELGRAIPEEEDYFLDVLLLVVKSHILVPGTSREDARLMRAIENMTDTFQSISGFECRDVDGLRRQLFSHLRPAIHRCLFSIHLDNVLRDDITQKYPKLLETTRQAAIVLEREYDIRLSADEMGYIAIMFGAQLTAEKLPAERRLFLVTEGGISSTTLLERQIRELTILPLDIVSCSVSEFLAQPFPTDAHMIITTADLPVGPRRAVPVLRVKHILGAQEQHAARNLLEGRQDERQAQSLIHAIMGVADDFLTAEQSDAMSAKIAPIISRFIGTN